MDEILVYKSVIDNNSSLKSIEDLRKANAILKKDLEQAGKVGSEGWMRINKTAQDTGKTFQEVNDSLKKQFTENKNKIDDFNRSLRQTSEGSGSINELRQEVIALAREYDALSKAERDSAKGLELRDKLFTTTEEVKKLEMETNRFGRNVGNYKGDILEAAKEMEIFGVKASSIIDPMKKVQEGFNNAGGGVNGFIGAFASGGIGLAITGVQFLFKAIEDLGGVMDKVEQATEGISGGFRAFVSGGDAIAAGMQIAELTAELQDLNDEQIKSVLVNAQVNSQIKQLQTAAKDRTKTEQERIDLLNQADALAKKILDKDSKDALKTALNQEEQFRIKKNLSEQELDVLLFNNETLQNKYDYLNDLQIEKIRERSKNKVKIDGEEFKKLVQNRVELQNITDRYNEIVDKNAVKSNQLQDKIDADKKAKAEKAAAENKKRLDDIAALSEKYLLDDRQRLEKKFNDELGLIKGNGETEKELRLTIESEKQLALAKFDSDAQKAIEDRRKKALADKTAKEAEDFSKQSAFLSKQLQLDLQAADLDIKNAEQREKRKNEIKLMSLEKQLELTRQFALSDGIISEEEIQKLKEIELAIRAIREGATTPTTVTTLQALGISKEQMDKGVSDLQMIQNAITAVQGIVSNGYQIRLNEIQSQYQAEIQGIEASSLTEEQKKKKIGALKKQQAQEEYQVQLKQFKVNKAMQIISATINTALAVMNALATMSYPASLVFAALAAATGAVQIGVIASQKPPAAPKFAKGGLLSGPSHAQGGIKAGGVELEGDEMVVTKGAGRNVKSRSIASFINRMFGGVRYPGAVNLPNNLQNAIQAYVGHSGSSFVASTYGKFAAGGFVPSFPKLTTDQIGSNASLLEEMRGLRDAIMGMPSPVVSVVEINKGQKQVNLIENAGTN